MDKKLILAKAGSGKTYYICNSLDETKNNIIISYTNNNVKNIENELIKRFGYIPKNTKIMTFHVFIHRYLVRPYENTIYQHFADIAKNEYESCNTEKEKKEIIKKSKGLKVLKDGYTKGVTKLEPQPSQINGKHNYKYVEDRYITHYLQNNKYYATRICKLPLKVNCNDKTKVNRKNNYKLITRAMANLNKYVDYFYIDECQDFREDYYSLLEEIIHLANNIILVGDYSQHSTNAINHTGKPFTKKGKVTITFEEYLNKNKDLGLEVDTTTLLNSRRCSVDVCNFVKEKLHIDIEGEKNKFNSKIEYVEDDNILSVLNDDNIVKLIPTESKNYKFRAVNWGASKGDTYENICVILTNDTSNILEDDFSINTLKQITINKLYVAITRAKCNVSFIKLEDFKRYKDEFLL